MLFWAPVSGLRLIRLENILKNLVVLDVELTGLDISAGHRIASLGLVKLALPPSTDSEREWFFKTDIPTDADGMRVHGMSQEYLSRFPDFQTQSQEIAEFIGEALIVHHCWLKDNDSSADEDALASEFNRAGLAVVPHARWINIKKAAIALSATANSLNDMLDRFGIDRSARIVKHGALIDAQLTTQLLRKMREDTVAAPLLQKLMP